MTGVAQKFLDPENKADYVVTGMPPKKMFRLFRKHFKYVKAAGGIVKNPAGEYLFIRRFNIWDLPKGKLKKKETPGKGALREVMEETGVKGLKIEKKLANTYHVYTLNGKNYLKKTHWFLMSVPEKQNLTPQTVEEITEAKWLEREKSLAALKESYRSLHDILSPFIR
ncbi:MAG: NUDIX domain-containing protein [Chlorobi bacterium]|nr:NUDIX domain-containing protein [Chlorobiota bacterium]